MTPVVRGALEEALRGGTAPAQRAQAPVCLFGCVCVDPGWGAPSWGTGILFKDWEMHPVWKPQGDDGFG